MELGVGLIRLGDPQRGGELLQRIAIGRQQIASKTGIVMPRIQIRDSIRIRTSAYQFLLDGARLGYGELDGAVDEPTAILVEHLLDVVKNHLHKLAWPIMQQVLLDDCSD